MSWTSKIGLLGRRMALALFALGLLSVAGQAQTDPLPSWNDGAAERVIVAFVTDTTTAGQPGFVPQAERIATFDQDGTLVYGIPPEQVVGTAGVTKYGYARDGKPFLIKEPKFLLNDNDAGKPEGIHLMTGRRSVAAFGNSTGDREMLEYAWAGGGPRLSILVLHDDAVREYAYGPAQGLPESRVGTFTRALYDEAGKNGWTVISMKNDWKRIFSFEPERSGDMIRFPMASLAGIKTPRAMSSFGIAPGRVGMAPPPAW
jgi:hypothetical protein